MITRGSVRLLLTSLLFTAAYTNAVLADDTDIYLGDQTNVIRPNLLFVLDTSDSMNQQVPGTGKTRLENMREAMQQILLDVDNINVGLMRFNGRRKGDNHTPTGGAVIFPVTDIDAPLSSVPSEANSIRGISVPILESADDATQIISTPPASTNNGQISLNSTTLDINQSSTIETTESFNITTSANDAKEKPNGAFKNDLTGQLKIQDQKSNSNHKRIGLRFENLNIPADATIIYATVHFTAKFSDFATMSILIRGEDSTSPTASAAFTGANGDLKSRYDSATTQSVQWSPGIWLPEQIVNTPNLEPIFSHLTASANGWTSGDDVVLLFEDEENDPATNAKRRAYSFNEDPAKAPTLTVTYSVPNTSNDVQTQGLRFQNVLIPQGAAITSAHLEFTAADPAGNTVADPQLWVGVENTGDSAPFTTSAFDMVDPSFTSPPRAWGNWRFGNIPAIGAEFDQVRIQESGADMDLTSTVQTVVDRSDWCGGNAMSFIVFPYDYYYPSTSTPVRRLKSFDSPTSPSDPVQRMPRLVVEYDMNGITGADTGCIRQTFSYQPGHSKDDATESLVDNTVKVNTHLRTGNTLTYDNVTPTTTINGIRFPDINLAQNSTILEAYLELTVRSAGTGATTLDIHGEKTDNALRFEAVTSNLSDSSLRPRTSASGSLAITQDNLAGEVVRSGDISGIITEIISDPAWAPNNAINLFISGGSSERRFHSYNSSTPFSPRLVMVVSGGAEADVRQRLLQLVNEQLFTLNRTPTVETLYEAANYWRGDEVYYGRHRGQGGFPNGIANPNDLDAFHIHDNGTPPDNNTIAKDGSLDMDPDEGMNYGRVSHPDSYTGGLLNQPAGCTSENLNAASCFAEVIDDHPTDGPPIYVSPFSIAECQSNYMIFLSDGAPTQNNEAPGLISNLVPTLSTPADCVANSKNNPGKCARDLLKFLHEKDQSASILGDQTVATYTIGFNTGTSTETFMQELAADGGGTFHTADTAAQLSNVFQAILQNIFADTSSFAAPSLTVNAFNKLFHRNEVYFSLFEPSNTLRWDGNIKKYRICDGTGSCTLGEVIDADDAPAVGSDGVISPTARSIWSTTQDGPTIKIGGAGQQMPDHSLRKIYSYHSTTAPDPANPVDLGLPEYQLNVANRGLYDQLLGFPNGDTSSDLDELIQWIRGVDTEDEDQDGSITDNRWLIADPLHGSPLALTYGCVGGTSGTPCPDTGTNAIVKVLVASNDGSIRLFNGSNDPVLGGQEEWAFYPQQVLINQTPLKDNPQGDHIYGVDSTPTVIQFDSDGDAIIDPDKGEFVRAFFTMRRGGTSIFALDVTPDISGGLVDNSTGKITPQYLWRIDGQSSLFPEFTNLGQTWSQPKPAFVRVPKSGGGSGDSEYKEVLIFGGGYDPNQDNGYGTSNIGNSIFIIDAATGERIWWASNEVVVDGNGDAPDLVLAEMDYPIPSDIALLDANGDGATNRLYVGDMGGQVWRIDLDDQLGGGTSGPAASQDQSSGARLAVLSNTNPAAANIEDHRKFFYAPDVIQTDDTIFAGQEYDLVTIVSGDRTNPLEQDVLNRAYGLRDYMISEPLTETGQYPLRHGVDTDGDGNDDLFDTTDNLIQAGDATQQQAAKDSLIASSGWFIDLTDSGSKIGEKGLSSPVVLAGKLFFTTFVPGISDPCQASEGSGRLYGIDAINASALFEDWLAGGDDTKLETGDRTFALGGGIPSSAVPIFQKQGVTLLIGTGGGARSVDPDIALPRVRTYWYEE